jgi:hypothetical protein
MSVCNSSLESQYPVINTQGYLQVFLRNGAFYAELLHICLVAALLHGTWWSMRKM